MFYLFIDFRAYNYPHGFDTVLEYPANRVLQDTGFVFHNSIDRSSSSSPWAIESTLPDLLNTNGGYALDSLIEKAAELTAADTVTNVISYLFDAFGNFSVFFDKVEDLRRAVSNGPYKLVYPTADSSNVLETNQYSLGSEPTCPSRLDVRLLPASYENITSDVTSVEIGSGALPGYFVLYDSTAFPIILGGSDTAVFGAAGIVQQACGAAAGRAVAFSHGSFITAATSDMTVNGMSTLMLNAVRWVGQSQSPVVALQHGSSLISDLAAAKFGAFSYAEVSDAEVLSGGLSGYDVLFAEADHYSSDALVLTLRQFLRNGGGIIFYGTSW